MQQPPLNFSLSLANGQQSFRIPGAYGGTQQIVLACATYPAAGTLSLEYQLVGDTLWRPVPNGSNLPFAGPIVLATYGAVAGYRVTLAGLGAGGSGFAAWVAEADPEGFPAGAFVGLRALTVQSYIEANVKNGVQYEVSSYNPALGVGLSQDTVFITGSQPVLVKTRLIGHDSNKMVDARVYKNTVFTAGSGQVVPYFNLNDRNPVAGGVTIRAGAAISNIGTEFGAATYSIGTSAQAQNTVGTFQNSGFERLLSPNTTYALRVTNNGTQPCQVSAYLSWYEGGTDLPV